LKSPDQLSLGWRTDLIFPRFDAQVIERPGYLVVRTPHNPTFWWGNFLLFDRSPVDGDAARWQAHFEAEIAGRQPESAHIAFGVDSIEPFEMPADFARAGFTRHAGTVLTMSATQLRPPAAALPAGCRVAVLELPAQADAVVDQQVASDEGEHQPVAEYRSFRVRQMQRYGAMQRAGLGHWFGVFARTGQGERLVADCGLFRDGAGAQALGRFQFVSTHPAWRRQGLCRALVHAVCRHGFDLMGLRTLVIVADPDDVAIGLYESLGFRRGVSTWQLERRPANPPLAP
jgi:RimJ/RimL family protein N-acetyltransferase